MFTITDDNVRQLRIKSGKKSVQQIRKKNVIGPTNKLLLSFTVIASPLFKTNLHLQSTVLLNEFRSSPGALTSTE